MSYRVRQTFPSLTIKARPLAHAMAAASLFTLWPLTASPQALPGGLNVVGGQAQVSTSGSAMTVTNSANAILNWQSFSIGSGASVRFNQVGSSSAVLNRVVGNDPSSILGSLSSNGRVWLLNPNGILFGQGARVDVAGLVASTLRLNDHDWLAGRFNLFAEGSANAGIVNQGELRSSMGGHVMLIGATVRNEGDINAPGGQVVLAAGSSVELVDTVTPNVSVKLNAGAGEVLNLGRLMASGGRIDVHAATVNQNGIVRADSLSTGPGGEIVLQATDRLTLAGSSETSAIGDSGRGGQIHLLGREVGLLDAARVDASGGSGGGNVLVGGGLQGKDPNVPNAEAVYFGPQARIAADASVSGDGGRIILWSDNATRAFGSLSVRGGPLGGDGGFIETSGGWLDARPARIDTAAPLGRSGSWLLDPYDIRVSDSAETAGVEPDFTAVSESATIRWADISTALATGTRVTVSTGAPGNFGEQAGNIAIDVFESPSVNVGAGGSLSFIADGSIDITGSLAFRGASMPLTFLAGRSGQGVIRLPSTTITLDNGDITFGGFTTYNRAGGGTFQGATGHDANNPTGVDLSSASIDALGGTITLNGGSKYQGPGSGVNIFDSSLLARNIVVNGNTMDFGTTGAGITTSVATLEARQTMDLRGMGTTQGIAIGLESQLILTNSFPPASLQLFGIGQQNEGVLLDGSSTPFSLIFDKTGGSVAIDGSTGGSESAAVTIIGPGTSANVIDVSGGTTLTIGGVATITELSNARVSANPLDVNGVPFTLHGSQSLTLANSQITSGGPITVHADSMFLGSGTTITSNFAGPTALVLQGAGNGGIQAFNNLAGATALQVGAGSRWLVFATDVTGFDAGGLAYDFKRYNALPNDTPITTDVGNGLAFSVPQFATVTGIVQTKTYDGTNDGIATNVAASGVNQDQVVAIAMTGAVFASPDAGTNINVTLSGFSLQFEDVNQKPVFGYTPQYLLRGNINPAPVTVAVSGVNKVYDATTQANPVATVTSGLVGAETLGVNGFAQFPIKDVGTYPVSVDIALANGTNGGLASNYSVAPTVNVSASITPALLTVTGVTANNKIYDTTLTATLGGAASVAGLPGDVVTLGGTPLAGFSTKNAGIGIAVGVSGYTLSGPDAGNYSLVPPTGLRADITPATLNVNGLQASSKVYDSLTSAALSGSASVAALGSDVVTLTGTPLGNFVDKNVGTGKAVTLGGLSLTGVDAGNYVLSSPSLVAAITPATLTYVVDPVSMLLGQPIPTLTGAVTGFLGSDSLSDATTGNLAFSTSAANVRGAGAYAVTGGGLSAVNYAFVQDSGNATALSVIGVTSPVPPLSVAAELGVTRGLDPVRRMLQLVEPPKPNPGSSGLAEVVTTPPALASGALRGGIANATANFAAFNLGAMSAGEIQFLLDARDVYKKSTFAAAISKLEADPALADLPPCASLKEAEAGTCLVIESRQRELRDALEREQRVAAGTMPPTTQVQPATTAARPPPPAPSPAPAAGATVVGSAPPRAVEAAVTVTPISSSALFSERKRVRSAALPQIERKVAVLIGVGSYKDAVIPPLANSVGDARAMARLFENQLGYETLVLENVGKSQVAAALNRLALELKPHDSVVIYYAGHGELVQSTKLGYWQLADADSQRPETWLSNSDISRIVAAMPSSQVSLISDSCYSGSLIADDRIRASTAVVDPVALLTRKTVAIMTSGGNEPVFDSGKNGHSPFAYNLLRTLGQVNNWSPGGQVFERVRFAVAREVPQRPQYGASIAAGHQPGGDYLFEQRVLER